MSSTKLPALEDIRTDSTTCRLSSINEQGQKSPAGIHVPEKNARESQALYSSGWKYDLLPGSLDKIPVAPDRTDIEPGNKFRLSNAAWKSFSTFSCEIWL